MNSYDDKAPPTSLQKVDEYPSPFPAQYLEQEEERHVRDYFHILFRRKWTAITFFLVVVATVAIGSFLATPLYRASVTLKIDDENRYIVLLMKDNAPLNNFLGDQDYLQTQYKILKSRNLAKRVIRTLGLDKKWGSGPARLAGALPGEEAVNPRIVDMFLSKVTVSPVPSTRLVTVAFDSPDPVLAAGAANEIARSCKELNLDTKSESSEWQKEWLERQLQDMRAKVERSEEALNRYVSQQNIFYVQDETAANAPFIGTNNFAGNNSFAERNGVIDKISHLSDQLLQATTERINKELLLKETMQRDEGQPSAVLNNPFVESLRKEYMNRQSEYSRLLLVYKPDYPKMVKLQEELKQLKSQIDAEIENVVATIKKDYAMALKRENLFKAALDSQKRDTLNAHDKLVQYQILKRDAETNKELYSGILQRLKEVGVASNITKSNIQILDKADVPGSPYKPDTRRNLLLALFVGFFGGIGLALFVDHLDNTIKTPDDVEKSILLPSLGIVPSFPKSLVEPGYRAILPSTEQKGSSLLEAYRSIGTYIQFSSPVRPPKVILITSARRAEGKTTTCINLATTLANSNEKGIIIDGDLRKPALHKTFELDNSCGLSAFLTGHTEFDAGLIHETRIPNLHAIPAGIIPPNPSELLSSYRMKDLLSTLVPLYSFILIDSPPVLGLSDSLILSTLTDGVIMVIKAGDTPKDSVVQAKKLIKGVNGKILGAILNGVKESDLRYGSYSYYYSYYYYYSDESEQGTRTKKRKKGLGRRKDAA